MKKSWWKEEVIYQIYPRSFNDSNGDGIGDLQGIIQKLDYLESLGIDIIWLSPVYQSPNDDNGYDISDYYDIMDEFGTMDDFDELLQGIHARGMKLLMDLVVSHSSDEHAWFQESKSSLDNPKRDYYIWRPGKNGEPPTNWKSFFSGSTWEYDPKTGEYYLHLFTKKQPDLNWENPEVRKEVYKLMKFWLDKGIDGFRMDVISLISKRAFVDVDPAKEFNEIVTSVYSNGPRVHEFLKEMNDEVLSKYDMMTVGEGPGITTKTAIDYVGEDRSELNMIFHLWHMFIDHGPKGKYDPVKFTLRDFKKIFIEWDKAIGDRGWLSIFLDNHDFPRMVSRFGNDQEYRNQSAKMLAILLLTHRGTPCIYQGSEIGMTNVAFDSFDDYRDVEVMNELEEVKGRGGDLDKFLKAVRQQGRDNVRTPMQWDNSKHAGFTDGDPWIKLNSNYSSINVESQETDEDSILNFCRKALRERKKHPTLVYGDYECIDPDHPEMYGYWRWDESNVYLVLLNFNDEPVTFSVNEKFESSNLNVILNNYPSNPRADRAFQLEPWQGVLYKKQ